MAGDLVATRLHNLRAAGSYRAAHKLIGKFPVSAHPLRRLVIDLALANMRCSQDRIAHKVALSERCPFAVLDWRPSQGHLAILLALLSIGLETADPRKTAAQVPRLSVDLPVDATVGFRPDDILVAMPGRAPILRGDFARQNEERPRSRRAGVRAPTHGHLQLRLPTNFLADSPQLFDVTLQPLGPAELSTPIRPEAANEIDDWCNRVLEVDDYRDPASLGSIDALVLLSFSGLDPIEGSFAWRHVIDCPPDVVDRLDFNRFGTAPAIGPPVQRPISFRRSWGVQTQIEELAPERIRLPSIHMTESTNHVRILQQQPSEAPRRGQ